MLEAAICTRSLGSSDSVVGGQGEHRSELGDLTPLCFNSPRSPREAKHSSFRSVLRSFLPLPFAECFRQSGRQGPYFNQAIDRDPGYALAYAGLADAYSVLSNFGGDPQVTSFPRSNAAAERPWNSIPHSDAPMRFWAPTICKAIGISPAARPSPERP
jgi:hypothetical protein